MTDRTFDNKVAKLMELQNQMEEMQKQMDVLKDDIKAEMETRGVDAIITKKFKATWTEIISKRFDSTAFKQAYADLYNQFVKASGSKRFTYKSVA